MWSFPIRLALITALSPLATAIVHGTQATSLEFPFVAAVLASGWSGYSLKCTGVVVGPKTILTTASCVDGFSASSLHVRVGSADYTTGGRVLSVSKVIMHPSYSSSTKDYDYAILHLPSKAVGGGVTAITLASGNTGTISGLPVKLAGWGKLAASDRTVPTTLHEANMLTVGRSECNSAWASINSITSNMICIQPDQLLMPDTSACNGDQGGPIVDELGLTLYGIASYGTFNFVVGGCAAKPYPNVGSDIVGQRDWLESLIK